MKTNLGKQWEVNNALRGQQEILRTKYDDAIAVSQDAQQRQNDLIAEIEQLHDAIHQICPSKQLQSIETIGKVAPVSVPGKVVTSPNPASLSSTPPPQLITSRKMSVPTAAALKMGVGFPLNSLRKDDTGRILSTQCSTNDELLNECGICKKCTDQHLLAKCDTCRLYYHLGCLNPPLTRHPKRSKQYAWQCSECDKSDDSSPECKIIPKGPRRSRIRYSKDGYVPDSLRDSFGSEKSMLSRKSDESHHRTFNGSGKEIKQEGKGGQEVVSITIIPEIPVVADVSEVPEVPENSFVNETVPTTSTPIIVKKKLKKDEKSENLEPKKRGRKPKPKTSSTATSTTSSAMASPSQSAAPSKEETSNENHVKEDLTSFNQQQELIISKVDAFVPSTFPDISMSTQEKPKKGRPPKSKPSITQISNKLQKKQENIAISMDSKEEVSLIDLTRKIECPLEQYRPFVDIPSSIPYPASNIEMPKIADDLEPLPVLSTSQSEPAMTNGISDPIMNGGGFMNGEGGTSSNSAHHKQKKRKSHKRRHSHSPSSGELLPSGKKNKKKRKHKKHDLDEAPSTHSHESSRLPELPRIKMKFLLSGNAKKKTWSLPQSGTEGSMEPMRINPYEDVFNSSTQVSLT